MALPKRRHSRQRQAKRRTHVRIKLVNSLTPCPQCGQPKKTHRICQSCGFYAGREIFKKEEAKEKKGVRA